MFDFQVMFVLPLIFSVFLNTGHAQYVKLNLIIEGLFKSSVINTLEYKIYPPTFSRFPYPFLPTHFHLGGIHIWRQMIFGHFWPTYLPKSDIIRWSLTYLPTLKSDVICGCSLMLIGRPACLNLVLLSVLFNMRDGKLFHVLFFYRMVKIL